MDSKKILIKLNISSRILDDKRVGDISQEIMDSIYNKILEIDKELMPVFADIDIKVDDDNYLSLNQEYLDLSSK